MKSIVLKFGGSTLKSKGDLEKIENILRLRQTPFVLVVSAVSGVTNMLKEALDNLATLDIEEFLENMERIYQAFLQNPSLELHQRVFAIRDFLLGAQLIGEAPPFVYDYVLSHGERCSSLLLTIHLNGRGITCSEMLPEQFGLITDGTYGNATVDLSQTEAHVKQHFEEDQNYVVPGFYGVCDGKVTVLGRGGSDYTATSLAYCLSAERVELYKDVPGFMSCDPKFLKEAKPIRQLSYDEAAELSYFGAKILHHSAIEPASKGHIPVHIYNMNTFNPQEGPDTVISADSCITHGVVKSISFTDDVAVIQFAGENVGRVPGILGTIASTLGNANINIKSVITSQTSINVLISKQDIDKCKKATQRMNIPHVENILYKADISLIAAVGDGLLKRHSVAARIFSAVSRQGINVEMISAGASNVTIYFLVRTADRQKALKAIHEEFFSGGEQNP